MHTFITTKDFLTHNASPLSLTNPYVIGYARHPDHLWIELIRTHAPGQFQKAVRELQIIAAGLPLRGCVTGKARRRLFEMRGWRCVDKYPTNHYIMELCQYSPKR